MLRIKYIGESAVTADVVGRAVVEPGEIVEVDAEITQDPNGDLRVAGDRLLPAALWEPVSRLKKTPDPEPDPAPAAEPDTDTPQE